MECAHFNTEIKWNFISNHAGFCPGCALVSFALKNSRRRKKNQVDGPENRQFILNKKTTKSDFRDVVLAL